jgi:hypothetical protein
MKENRKTGIILRYSILTTFSKLCPSWAQSPLISNAFMLKVRFYSPNVNNLTDNTG